MKPRVLRFVGAASLPPSRGGSSPARLLLMEVPAPLDVPLDAPPQDGYIEPLPTLSDDEGKPSLQAVS